MRLKSLLSFFAVILLYGGSLAQNAVCPTPHHAIYPGPDRYLLLNYGFREVGPGGTEIPNNSIQADGIREGFRRWTDANFGFNPTPTAGNESRIHFSESDTTTYVAGHIRVWNDPNVTSASGNTGIGARIDFTLLTPADQNPGLCWLPINVTIRFRYPNPTYYDPSPGQANAFYRYMTKITLHEVGHHMGLNDQPFTNGVFRLGQTAGFSIMNGGSGVNDANGNMPEHLTNCDQLSIFSRYNGRPPCDPLLPPNCYNTLISEWEEYRGHCLYHVRYWYRFCDGVFQYAYTDEYMVYCDPPPPE